MKKWLTSLESRTVILIVLWWAVNTFPEVRAFIPIESDVILNTIFGLLGINFRINPKATFPKK